MRKYKYTKETLDVALEELQSESVVQRKKCVKFISMASLDLSKIFKILH